ncbi:MAG: UDP-N-acetylmuramoyl-L-alanine--D-glutamate ligase [Clostridiales bacterium]|nr:UDP-N-acetylmuramoyl-L-alanine--D-glutamate ligase [Clostridiales bacterium]
MGIFDGKRFFVYGDGLSGRAATAAIKKQGGKAKLYTDVDGRFAAPAEKRYDGAVISPGIRPTHAVYEYCARRVIRTTGEAEIGFKIASARNMPTVGVTGTNGKTTVTSLIAAMTGGAACGNIGYPVSTAALECQKPIVCELSSFQLYGSVVTPDVAVITNIASDHIDWHGSVEEYCACKCKIAANMCGGFLVLGEDIPIGALKTLETSAQLVRCSSTSICDGAYIADGVFYFMGKRVCPTDYLRLQGAHNVKNALCAIAAAMCMGASAEEVTSALATAELSPHRIRDVGTACGKHWIDDSKGTNVAACLAAVAQTSGTVCLIVGGRGKATDFSELFDALDTERVTEIVAMGETAQAIRDSAAKIVPSLKLTVVNGLTEAVKAAAKSDAKTVLLSPACASFDEFKSYAERGDKFAAEVTALGGSV